MGDNFDAGSYKHEYGEPTEPGPLKPEVENEELSTWATVCATLFFGGLIVMLFSAIMLVLTGCYSYAGSTRQHDYHWDTSKCTFYPYSTPHMLCEEGGWDYKPGYWFNGRWVNGYWYYVGW